MCIKDRIERLRQKMEEHHISVYMIPTADYHQSEYVGEHFSSMRINNSFVLFSLTLHFLFFLFVFHSAILQDGCIPSAILSLLLPDMD